MSVKFAYSKKDLVFKSKQNKVENKAICSLELDTHKTATN